MSLGGSITRFFSRDIEVRRPEAFALTPHEEEFRDAVKATLEPKRRQLAEAILQDSDLMANLNAYESLNPETRMATLKKVGEVQGKVMGFTPPPITAKQGVPEGGTLGSFSPSSYAVTVYPDAMARAGKWAPFITIVHEMEHAYQYSLVQRAKVDKPRRGTPERILADSFKDSMKISQRGLDYLDYAHLNVEFDAFQTGNRVGTLVSKGQADTRNLGSMHAQYDASGNPKLDLDALEERVGKENLSRAVDEETRKNQGRGGASIVHLALRVAGMLQ